MLALSDPLWETFAGGYRVIYNAAPVLERLETATDDVDSILGELWEELHHQGTIGLASYAAVPHLVRISLERNLVNWNIFGLVAVIEQCRIFGEGNPPMPDWLQHDYQYAIEDLADLGARHFSRDWSTEMTQAFLAMAAFANGQPNTGRVLIQISEAEMKEAYDKFFE